RRRLNGDLEIATLAFVRLERRAGLGAVADLCDHAVDARVHGARLVQRCGRDLRAVDRHGRLPARRYAVDLEAHRSDLRALRLRQPSGVVARVLRARALLREQRDAAHRETDLARLDGLLERRIRAAKLEAGDRRVAERVGGLELLERALHVALVTEVD